MKVYLISDMEGATGVVRFDNRKRLFARFRSQGLIERYIEHLTMDVVAAVEGALDAGATEVLVCDGHGNLSIIENRLSPIACLVPSGSEWMPLLDKSVDALIMIGFHAKAGTRRALLSHSFSRRIKDVRLNNKSVGEIELCAMYAGAYNVSAVFLSGDDYAVMEARGALPDIETATVKYSHSRLSAVCLPPEKTYKLIREGVSIALKQLGRIKPLQPIPPFKLTRVYRWPGVALMRRFITDRFQGSSAGLYGQIYEDTDFLALINRFFGYRKS